MRFLRLRKFYCFMKTFKKNIILKIIMIKRQPTRQDFFTVATIFAILSGGWIVGAGIFTNIATTSAYNSLYAFDSALGIVDCNNTLPKEILLNVSIGYNTVIKPTLGMATFLFEAGTVFAGIALILCAVGAYLVEDKKE